MKKDLQGGLQNILDAINNLIEPKLGNLKYDRTYRGKITSNEGDNTYKVLVNGKEYSAIYTGNKIPVGQIVKVKAPLNNFSDIYIETLPGSSGGEEGDYNSLVNKPILNTNNTETQVAKTAETIQGTISLHKISKTGNYNDLLNKPSLDFIPTSEKGQPNGVASLDKNGKIVKSDLPADTVYDNNYVHTDNNFTNALKDKLDSVEEGAEPNKIETIQKNGVNLDIVNKTVNVEVPTKTSDILNDSGFLTEVPIASTSRVGGIKVGNNLSITEDGTLNAEAGGVISYSALTDKPILNTANSSSLSANNNETINGIISLHKISKTGSYEDLLNKPTIPTKTSDLTNDSGFITNTVDNLTNYYLKSETYTQSEVNNLIGQIKTISIEVVDTLPTTGEDNKIYLVPKEGSTGDIYNEYIWVNNAWELIGTTQVDLTGYATEDWVNTQIKDFVTESQVTQIVNNSLTNYYTQTQIDNLLKDKANTSDIPTKTSDLTNDSGFINNSVNNLVNYYNKTETYNQSEINNLLSNKANTSDIPTKTGDLTNNGDGTAGSKYITNTDLSAGLDSKQDKITGGATTIVSDNLPANKALISNANGKVAVSDTTSAELGYLSGARSNLQGQIDAITTEGGQPNVIEVVQENGTPLEVNNKTVNVIAPTNLVNGIATGSLRTVGSTKESDTYKLGQYAFAEGINTRALGHQSHVEGFGTMAVGDSAHAEGSGTTAGGNYSHAEGNKTTAGGHYSHAEGKSTIANGTNQHVQGIYNIADTTSLDIIGNGTSDDNRSNAYTLDKDGNAWYSGDVYVGSTSGTNKDNGSVKLAKTTEIPTKTSDITNDSGFLTEIPIASSTVLGGIKVGNNLSITTDGVLNAEAGGVSSYNDLTDKPTLNTTNINSLATNSNETINGTIDLHKVAKTGDYNDLNNKLNLVNGNAIGSLRTVGATSESDTYKLGKNALAEGSKTIAAGENSHAEGYLSKTGQNAFTIVSGNSENKTYVLDSVTGLSINMEYSLKIPNTGVTFMTNVGTITAIDKNTNTVTVSDYRDISSATGYFFIMSKPSLGNIYLPNSGYEAHAEGYETYASNFYSHAEGSRTIAGASSSHAEGNYTETLGEVSHSEGAFTVARGDYSHAEGYGTIANGENQHVQGKYNIVDNTSLDIVGNGIYTKRSNAYTLDAEGNGWFSGEVYVGSTSGTNKDEGSVKLAKITDIPTKTSDLANDSDFINNSVNNLTNYYPKTETYTQTQVNNLLNNKADKREVMVAGVNRKSWTVSGSWGKVNLLPLQNNNHSGSGKLTYTTNGIKIGSGVTKVLVSASFKGIDYSKFLGDVYVNIVKKRGTNELSGADVYNTHIDIGYFSMDIPPTILDVVENDLLYLSFGSGVGGTGEILGASLCVEVLE